MTALFTLLALLACVGVQASFQVCAGADNFQSSMITEYTCAGVAQGECVGTGLAWDDGSTCKAQRSVSVHTKIDNGTELASNCAAVNGTASNGMTCAQFVSHVFSNAAGPDKAFCLAKNANMGNMTNKFLLQFVQAMGCCGTAEAQTQCDVVAKPEFQLCSNDTDYQPYLVQQIKCNGLTNQTCKGTVQGGEFSWDQDGGGYTCRIGAVQAVRDLNAACTSKNGTSSDFSTCGQLVGFFFTGIKSDKAGCSAKPQQMQMFATNAKTAEFLAGFRGCCKGATHSTPKTTCAPFFPKMEVCQAGTYRPDRQAQGDCAGVAQANCSGTGSGARLEWNGMQCSGKATMADAVDIRALCESKMGTVSNLMTCAALSNAYFPDKVSNQSGCASASMGSVTVKFLNDYMSGTLGCCQGGQANSCCADPSKCNIATTTTSMPPTTSTAAPTTTTTTTAAPAPGTQVPNNVVSVVVTLNNIDFDKIEANISVKTKLVDSIKQSFLDKLTGYTKQDLTVDLTRGSVVANVKITPQVGSDSAALKIIVKAELANIEAAVVTSVKAISEVAEFLSTGKTLADITATAADPVEVDATPTAASKVSMAAVMSASALATACLLAF